MIVCKASASDVVVQNTTVGVLLFRRLAKQRLMPGLVSGSSPAKKNASQQSSAAATDAVSADGPGAEITEIP